MKIVDLFSSIILNLMAFCSPKPDVKLEQYDVVIYALGGAHNFFALLVLVTYFLSNHPTLPAFTPITKLFR